MARPGPGQRRVAGQVGQVLGGHRVGRHDRLPLGPLGVAHPDGHRAAQRPAVPGAAGDLHLVLLELHPRAAAVPGPPPGQRGRDVRAGDLDTGRDPLADSDQRAAMRLTRGQPAHHVLDPPTRGEPRAHVVQLRRRAAPITGCGAPRGAVPITGCAARRRPHHRVRGARGGATDISMPRRSRPPVAVSSASATRRTAAVAAAGSHPSASVTCSARSAVCCPRVSWAAVSCPRPGRRRPGRRHLGAHLGTAGPAALSQSGPSGAAPSWPGLAELGRSRPSVLRSAAAPRGQVGQILRPRPVLPARPLVRRGQRGLHDQRLVTQRRVQRGQHVRVLVRQRHRAARRERGQPGALHGDRDRPGHVDDDRAGLLGAGLPGPGRGHGDRAGVRPPPGQRVKAGEREDRSPAVLPDQGGHGHLGGLLPAQAGAWPGNTSGISPAVPYGLAITVGLLGNHGHHRYQEPGAGQRGQRGVLAAPPRGVRGQRGAHCRVGGPVVAWVLRLRRVEAAHALNPSRVDSLAGPPPGG